MSLFKRFAQQSEVNEFQMPKYDRSAC